MQNKESFISFKPLRKLLIDKELTMADLCRMTGITPSTMSAVKADKSVNLSIVVRICRALNCSVEEVLEIDLDNQI